VVAIVETLDKSLKQQVLRIQEDFGEVNTGRRAHTVGGRGRVPTSKIIRISTIPNPK
jgi:hypothetical protein